jgi:hypothetical protein
VKPNINPIISRLFSLKEKFILKLASEYAEIHFHYKSKSFKGSPNIGAMEFYRLSQKLQILGLILIKQNSKMLQNSYSLTLQGQKVFNTIKEYK